MLLYDYEHIRQVYKYQIVKNSIYKGINKVIRNTIHKNYAVLPKIALKSTIFYCLFTHNANYYPSNLFL